MEFGGDHGEVGGIALHQVPGIGGETVLHPGGETGRAEEVDPLFAPEAESQQMIEADEMVDVGMGDEDVGKPQDLAGRERHDVPQIEEERPPFVKEIDVECRIVEGAVNKDRMELGRHASRSFLCCRCYPAGISAVSLPLFWITATADVRDVQAEIKERGEKKGDRPLYEMTACPLICNYIS